MYHYTDFDRAFVQERVNQFRGQVERRIDGSLKEEEFRPLRLMNGLYLQLHAYMLRVAIPYGTLRSDQMRTLALLAEKWDRGYGHFTTRQNIQYNWPALSDVPDMLQARICPFLSFKNTDFMENQNFYPKTGVLGFFGYPGEGGQGLR